MDALNDLISRVAVVHEEDIFLPSTFVYGTCIPYILVVAVTLTVIYLLSFQLLDALKVDATSTQRSKLCYQITNVAFNVAIGICGIYCEYVVLPKLPIENNDVDLILGHENELYATSVLQLGYQLWAIPVGLLYVGESSTMLIHHLAVVVSTSMTGFLSIGLRYYSPFFYGIMELSSIPLSVMNTIKDDPKLQAKYPAVLASSRTIFAVTFIFIRIYMCAYRWPRFLLLNFVVMYTREWGAYKVYMILQWLMAVFLATIQFYWAFLILKGIAKMLSSGDKDKKGKKA